LPAPIRNASSDDADYKALFSLNQLQVVSTLNFGAVGIQKQTRTKHPLWISMHEQVRAGETIQAENSSQSIENDVNSEVQRIFAEAKDFNATIKKSVIAQFSTNLDLMYKNGKRLKNAIEKTLRILLKLHLQPKKERSRRKYINELQATSDTSHTVVTANSIFSRNKKRSLLNKYRKQLQKYQEKNKTNKADKVARKIEHIKELQWKKKVIYELDTTERAVNKYTFYI
jgi:paraquat-inducible protein B